MFQKNISEEKKKKTRNVDLTAFLVFFMSHYRYFLYGCSSDAYAYNYELLGTMLDEMINNLTGEQRFEFQDIVQKKKQRLIAKFKKEYKK